MYDIWNILRRYQSGKNTLMENIVDIVDIVGWARSTQPCFPGPTEPKAETFSFPSFGSWLAAVPELVQGTLGWEATAASELSIIAVYNR